MNSGYRAFPETIKNPSTSAIYSEVEFQKITNKQLLEEAPSQIENHNSTKIWYVENQGYIVEVVIENSPYFIESICTFTPQFGMDKIDGLFAQDAEEFILNKHLQFVSTRLKIFNNQPSIPTSEYLMAHGVIKNEIKQNTNPWWKLW